MPQRIFISYRREDTAANALGIGQYLEKEFGRKSVFIDVDMRAGAKFPAVLEQRLAQCARIAEKAKDIKRLLGELSTHAASAQCSNAPMVAAFNEAHYRCMDLIESFAAKRLQLAARIDRGELSEQQAQIEIQKAYQGVQDAERRRDSGMK